MLTLSNLDAVYKYCLFGANSNKNRRDHPENDENGQRYTLVSCHRQYRGEEYGRDSTTDQVIVVLRELSEPRSATV